MMIGLLGAFVIPAGYGRTKCTPVIAFGSWLINSIDIWDVPFALMVLGRKLRTS